MLVPPWIAWTVSWIDPPRSIPPSSIESNGEYSEPHLHVGRHLRPNWCGRARARVDVVWIAVGRTFVSCWSPEARGNRRRHVHVRAWCVGRVDGEKMAHRTGRDVEEDGWERSDFPILCETCLGPNPFVRMTKADYHAECKICTRPFTVFRWKPGAGARHKKTEICQTCAKAKHVCQTCLLDLQYNLPVQVRDAALGITEEEAEQAVPKSQVTLLHWAEEQDKLALTGQDQGTITYGKAPKNELLERMKRKEPYYKRNEARICSFFVKGCCKRGKECPYRHEMPQTGELANQNMKDRYYGVNDPVARKLMRGDKERNTLVPPEDESVATFFVGGLEEGIEKEDLAGVFYPYGELKSVNLVPLKRCAFVTFVTRGDAERAGEALAGNLVVKGKKLKLMWGKPLKQRDAPGLPRHKEGVQQIQPPAPPPPLSSVGAGAGTSYYPSMDPQTYGSKIVLPAEQKGQNE